MLICAVIITIFSHFMGWVGENWAYLALGFSEALAFIPIKYQGIAKLFWGLLQALFKKSEQMRDLN